MRFIFQKSMKLGKLPQAGLTTVNSIICNESSFKKNSTGVKLNYVNRPYTFFVVVEIVRSILSMRHDNNKLFVSRDMKEIV